MHRLDEIADRVNRIETAVDATAIEVERISEGQRFTTRLLADRPVHRHLPTNLWRFDQPALSVGLVCSPFAERGACRPLRHRAAT
jgi:hypothetical protein